MSACIAMPTARVVPVSIGPFEESEGRVQICERVLESNQLVELIYSCALGKETKDTAWTALAIIFENAATALLRDRKENRE